MNGLLRKKPGALNFQIKEIESNFKSYVMKASILFRRVNCNEYHTTDIKSNFNEGVEIYLTSPRRNERVTG